MKSVGIQTAVMILAMTMLFRTFFPLEFIVGKSDASAVSYMESRGEILAAMGSSLVANGMEETIIEVFSSFGDKFLK